MPQRMVTAYESLMYVLYGAQSQRAQSRQRGAQSRPELFSFATRLTRLTPALAAASPDTMLVKAGEAAPDWSGGTRIVAALKEFNDRYGAPGMARGAVVLIISDGWDTGDPELLGQQMARLALDWLDLAGLPGLVEERRERVVEPQDREEAFARNGLDPVACLAVRCCWTEVDVR
jgi:hypothetical protein